VANGIVYVGSNDGGVYALDAATGKVLWKVLTVGAVDSSPEESNGVVYVGSDDKSVYAISVPEPATWVMMLLGFAGLGFGAFRPTTKQTPEAIA
jgi:glucose dehydrogenase